MMSRHGISWGSACHARLDWQYLFGHCDLQPTLTNKQFSYGVHASNNGQTNQSVCMCSWCASDAVCAARSSLLSNLRCHSATTAKNKMTADYTDQWKLFRRVQQQQHTLNTVVAILITPLSLSLPMRELFLRMICRSDLRSPLAAHSQCSQWD